MELNMLLSLAAAALAGVLLAIFYFGGLWLTIRKSLGSNHPAWLLTFSFILRLVVVMAGFYLVSNGKFDRMLACLSAFFLTRFLAIKYMQPGPERILDTYGNQS